MYLHLSPFSWIINQFENNYKVYTIPKTLPFEGITLAYPKISDERLAQKQK